MSFHHFYPLSFTSKPPSNNRNIVSWLLAKYCMLEQWSSFWTLFEPTVATREPYTHAHLIPHFHIWIHKNGWHYTYWRGQGFRQRHFESIFQGGALCISCLLQNSPSRFALFFPPLLMPAPLADIDGNYFAITNRFLFLWSTVINGLLFWYWMVLANFAHISH